MNELVGRPFVWGGRDPAVGLDCLGVTLLVAARRGRPLPDPWQLHAERWQAGERELEELCRLPDGWVAVEPVDARRDDVVAFSENPGGRDASHIGYLIEDGLLISARYCLVCRSSGEECSTCGRDFRGVYTARLARLAGSVVAVWRRAE